MITMKYFLIYKNTHYKINTLPDNLSNILTKAFYKEKDGKLVKKFRPDLMVTINETDYQDIVKHITANSNLSGVKLQNFVDEHTNLSVFPQNMFRTNKVYGYRPIQILNMEKGFNTIITLWVEPIPIQ